MSFFSTVFKFERKKIRLGRTVLQIFRIPFFFLSPLATYKKMSVPETLGDVLDPLSVLAAQVLDDPYGRGMQFSRAVARGNTKVVRQPGARINVHGGIVLGAGLRGKARGGSFVVDLGAGKLDAHDSVVVGNSVRVLSRGKTTVVGRSARVSTKGGSAAARSSTVHRKKDVMKRKTFISTEPSEQSACSTRRPTVPTKTKSRTSRCGPTKKAAKPKRK